VKGGLHATSMLNLKKPNDLFQLQKFTKNQAEVENVMQTKISITTTFTLKSIT